MAKTLFPATMLLLATVLPLTPGRADTTIRLDGSRDVARTVIQVKGDMVRLAPSARSAYVLFDKARNLAIYVDTARRTYTEIDPPTLEKYAAMVSAVRRQMQSQLQMLPPRQRAILEQHMGDLMGLPRSELPDLDTLHTVARGDRTVAGFHCQLHLVLKDKQAIGDVCLSTAAEAGVSAADFATLMAMMDFLRHVASTAQELAGGLTESSRLLLNGLQGLPVAARDYRSRQQFVVAEVSRQPLDPGQFDGYRGYRKEELLEAMAMGR
jgi:hypothetical protein